jgi:hypothetical protein
MIATERGRNEVLVRQSTEMRAKLARVSATTARDLDITREQSGDLAIKVIELNQRIVELTRASFERDEVR